VGRGNCQKNKGKGKGENCRRETGCKPETRGHDSKGGRVAGRKDRKSLIAPTRTTGIRRQGSKGVQKGEGRRTAQRLGGGERNWGRGFLEKDFYDKRANLKKEGTKKKDGGEKTRRFWKEVPERRNSKKNSRVCLPEKLWVRACWLYGRLPGGQKKKELSVWVWGREYVK